MRIKLSVKENSYSSNTRSFITPPMPRGSAEQMAALLSQAGLSRDVTTNYNGGGNTHVVSHSERISVALIEDDAAVGNAEFAQMEADRKAKEADEARNNAAKAAAEEAKLQPA